ncbi:MAG: hypothetical protein QM796_03525 [Chthoniobacteraceae bacterium]
METRSLLFRFQVVIAAFMVGLILSGVTAFPLLSEMKLLTQWLGVGAATSTAGHSGVVFWILTVRFGLEDMYQHYPWIAYGTDWLAFAHLVIAIFFIGPLLQPRGSRSVLWAGVVACASVIPLALIAGPIRGIPFYWRLIDCSFGICGVVPLLYCLQLLRKMESSEIK